MDILAANDACGGILSTETMPLNLARFMFLDPRALDLFREWSTLADDFAAALRIEAGRSPNDTTISSLIGELATGSSEFSKRWARHNVRIHRSARKTLHNPLVGDIELTGESLDLPADGLTMIVYTVEPGSHAQEQLDFLANWSATQQRASKPGPEPLNVELATPPEV